MRPQTIALLAGLAALGLAMLVVAAQPNQTKRKEPERSEHSSHKLPKLFDFDQFKSLFGKKYGSSVEELSRKRYFFASAFHAFVTGVMYKFRRLSYYEAVNPMSDWSDEEREQMLNQAMVDEQKARKLGRPAERDQFMVEIQGDHEEEDDEVFHDAQSEQNEQEEEEEFFDVPEFLPDAGEDVEGELAKLIEEHASEPGFEELQRELRGAKRRRQKRQVGAPREFSFNKLLATPDSVRADGDDEVSPKLTRNVASNNDNYEPIELASQWSSRDMEEVKWMDVHKVDSRSFGEQARDFFSLLNWNKKVETTDEGAGGEADDGRDKMFVDLRQTGCIARVRNQGRCGSCYAFAALTVMEYHFCLKMDRLVEFSEQYMVDCGKDRFGWTYLSGCKGATVSGTVKFLQNFGLEPRWNYPYLGKQGQCPLDESVDIERTGYIRMPLGSVAQVHMDMWPEVLLYGPMYIGLATGKDFAKYGGGVYNGKGCGWFENHAMVLVGHGREDGQEFWLIRNSYGKSWGERGYLKIAKKYARKCTRSARAIAFGTENGIDYDWQTSLSNPGTMTQATLNSLKKQ